MLWLIRPELEERIIKRICGSTVNTETEAQRKLSNALAYLWVRSTMENPNADLVINLGPDEAWHAFIHFTKEYMDFCHNLAGVYLHHDPAPEAGFVNSREDTEKTVALFKKHGIPYDEDLWEDWLRYPNGAEMVRSRIVQSV